MDDIDNDKREIDVINRSISRLEYYDRSTQKVDVSNIDEMWIEPTYRSYGIAQELMKTADELRKK